jgi:arylsulfatase
VSKHPGDWELYDMVADRTELHDLREANRTQAKKMIADYEVWAEAKQVCDWPVVRE